jgi:2,3-bisphosphoglycerate-dependent phosphoglycerate mutase
MSTLILLRHGESEWNRDNLFTGWYDADLSETGVLQAVEAGRLMAEAELRPVVAFTSVQTRAIRTLDLALAEMGLLWIPVHKHWRLNERHYGDLQGLNKKETREKFGDEQLMAWRRSYDTPPPPLAWDDPRHARFDPRYAGLAPDVLPASECLADVVERMLPYWHDAIVPALRVGTGPVLVSAHGNSLRALVKHLDAISDDEIASLNIPTGIPLVYELDDRMQPAEAVAVDDRYLGGADAARKAAEAVANQAR